MFKHETLPAANVQTWFRTAEEMKALLTYVRNWHEIMIFWVHLLTFPFCNYWDSSDLTCKTWGVVCFLLSSSGHYRFITNNLGLSCGEFWCSCFARHMDLGSDNLRTLDLGRVNILRQRDMGIMKWLMKQWQCHRFDYTVTSMKRWVKKKKEGTSRCKEH